MFEAFGVSTMVNTHRAPALDQISFLDPAIQADPYPAYRTLHKEQPVYRMPETGVYMITRYEDVRTVIKDTETFSSDMRTADVSTSSMRIHLEMMKEKGWLRAQTLQRTDPPRHDRYRKLLNRVFTGPRVAALTPRIERLVDDLIDAFIDKGECEFVGEFALPLPGIVIAEQIGLESSKIKTFKSWADAMLAFAQRPLSDEEARKVTETEIEAQHYLAKEFEDRRHTPREDIISGLVHAHGEDEEPFDMNELQDLMHQLITGGYETTTSALSQGVLLLIERPDLLMRLRQDLSLVDRFVEESLRFKSPVQGLWRQTTRDVVLGGTAIPKGASVMIRFAAANRDADKFERPDELDIDREMIGAHIAFGAGVHRCIGMVLARAELKAAYRSIVSRLDKIALKYPDREPVYDPSIFLYPVSSMHLTFEAVK